MSIEIQPVLDKLSALQGDVQEIKLELAEQRGAALKGRVEDLESRVRVLERWCWGLAGGLALLGVLVGLVAKLLP